jgi:hypothetical protein
MSAGGITAMTHIALPLIHSTGVQEWLGRMDNEAGDAR